MTVLRKKESNSPIKKSNRDMVMTITWLLLLLPVVEERKQKV